MTQIGAVVVYGSGGGGRIGRCPQLVLLLEPIVGGQIQCSEMSKSSLSGDW